MKEENFLYAPGANAVGMTLMMSRALIPASVSTDVEEVAEESDVLESAVGVARSLLTSDSASSDDAVAEKTEASEETVAAASTATTSAENSVMVSADKVVRTTTVDSDTSLAGPGTNQLIGDTDKRTAVKTPTTGDNSLMGIWIGIIGVALGGVVSFLLIKFRKKDEDEE